MGRGTCEQSAAATAALSAAHALPNRYTLCSALQRHFTNAVVPVLGLQHAGKDATRTRLERCIRDVRSRGADEGRAVV